MSKRKRLGTSKVTKDLHSGETGTRLLPKRTISYITIFLSRRAGDIKRICRPSSERLKLFERCAIRVRFHCQNVELIVLRALDSISLLRYVVTTQTQFYFRFSCICRFCLAAKFYFSYCFSVKIFFQSRKRVLQ